MHKTIRDLDGSFKSVKRFFKVINCLIILSAPLLVNNSALAVEFKREADKAVWIKDFFKDKEAEPSNYGEKWTKEEIKLREQLIRDFETQNGIEHLEPIAVGKINDPEISKFNTACPDKKPINFYKCCCYFDRADHDASYCEPEERLDDPGLADLTEEYKCSKDSNLKVYKFNVYNTPDNNQDYVLYCDDFVLLRSHGTIFDESRKRGQSELKGAYLKFDPTKCAYSDQVGHSMLYTKEKNFLTGIFKHKGKYYFYSIKTYSSTRDEEEKTSLMICGSGAFSCSYCCGKDYYNKNKVLK
jgi:hypothetical protein